MSAMVVFATTVFLSAFLLFQIQPIVAKMILPWFGGSSSVWSTCIVFFQSVLLLGYGYVHWLHEKISRDRQPLVHAALLIISLVTLPVAADASWKGMTLDYPSLAVLAVLAVACGAPYLLLSTTGPLMQAWYARVGVASGDGGALVLDDRVDDVPLLRPHGFAERLSNELQGLFLVLRPRVALFSGEQPIEMDLLIGG